MDFLQLASQFKELGWLGVLFVALIAMGKRLVDWVLERAGVDISRKQSREDTLASDVKEQGKRLDVCEGRLNKLEAAYEIAVGLAHSAADGIEDECKAIPEQSQKPIMFYVKQLRRIQTLKELWGTTASPPTTPPAST